MCFTKKKSLDLTQTKVKLYCTHFLLCEKWYISLLQYLFSRFSFWHLVVQRVCLKPSSRYAQILLSLLSEKSKLLCEQLIRPLWTNAPKGLILVSLSLFLFSITDFFIYIFHFSSLYRISKQINRRSNMYHHYRVTSREISMYHLAIIDK